MAAKIKLQRKGTKNRPFYRVVVQDEAAASKSSVIEILGRYNTLVEPSLFEVDKEKTQAWLDKGAQPTVKVRILLGKAGILPAIDLAALPKRKSKAELKKEAEAKGEEKPKPLDDTRGKEAATEAPKAEVKAEVKAEEKPPVEEVKKEEPKEEPKAPTPENAGEQK
ncbi:MAG: 30S ribosomal protein S16 [bacterium]